MKKYFLLFVFSFLIFIYHTLYTKHAIYGDGNGYYSYTQAIYFDKSLNFDPIYEHLSNFQGRNYIFSRIFWEPDPGPFGIKYNPFTIGTPLFWIPSMGFISLINNFFALGASRFDLIYELGPGITGIVLILSGLYFLEKYLQILFPKKSVWWVPLLLYFGSNIFYYTAFEPALSHEPSFFLVSFLLWWTKKDNFKNFFLLGILSGLLAIVRMVDSLLLIPIIIQARPGLKNLPAILSGFLIGLFPQLVNQYLQFGSIVINPYFTQKAGTWEINFVHFLQHLFSAKRGLFFWTPVYFLGFYGLVKSKKYFLFIFSIFLLWFVSSSWSAYLSAGFGQRFSFSASAFFAIGIVEIFKDLRKEEIFIYSMPFILWNLTLVVGFYMLELGG